MRARIRDRALVLFALGGAAIAGASCLFPSLADYACADGCGGSSSGEGGATGASSTPSSTVLSVSSTTATSSASTSTSSSSGQGGGASGCELSASMHGPTGTQIVPPGGFPSFCIDSTEVSVTQYRELYDANVFPLDASKFPTQCAWKGTTQLAFKPLGTSGDGGVADYIWGHYDNNVENDHPVQGIDWCDAAIYCQFAGKRLCGAESSADRHIDTISVGVMTGEWFRACEGPNKTKFGYGTTPTKGLCNTDGSPGNPDMDMDPFRTTPVTDPATCVATWSGGAVHDMNGNVEELDDSCDDGSGATPAEDICHPRGGAYNYMVEYTGCDFAEPAVKGYKRGQKTEYIGFRCCW